MKNSFNAELLRARVFRFRQCTALLALALILLTGCKSKQSESGAAAGAVVTYDLVSIGGQNVPCQITHGQAKLNVISGVFRFGPGGECESSIEFLSANGQTFRKDVSGTYARYGEKVNFRWKRAGRTEGRITDDVFTMNNEGIVFSYKQTR